MTIEAFARRVGTALALSGFGLLIAAVLFWITSGGGEVVRSIHAVAGSVVAVLGLASIGVGLAISASVPPPERESEGVDARPDDMRRTS